MNEPAMPAIEYGSIKEPIDRLGIKVENGDYVIFPFVDRYNYRHPSVEVGKVIGIHENYLTVLPVAGKKEPWLFTADKVIVIADEWLPSQYK